MTLTHSASTDPSRPFATAAELAPDQPALPGMSEQSMSSLELVIRWGDSILAARHLTPPRSFTLGDGGHEAGCDFLMPAEKLGAARHALVEVDDLGSVQVVVPRGASAKSTLDDGPTIELARPTNEAQQLSLAPGQRLCVEHGDFRFEIRGVESAAKVKGSRKRNKRALMTTLASAVAHVGMLVATAAFMPAIASAEDDTVTEQQHYVMQQYLDSAAELEREAELNAESADDAVAGDASDPSSTDSSSRYSQDAVAQRGPRGGAPGAGQPGHSAFSGPMTRADAIADAREFGAIQLLAALEFGNQPTPWGTKLVDDGFPSANGVEWGKDLFAGPGPLDLSGTGENSWGPADIYRVQDLMPRGPGGDFGPRRALAKRGHQTTVPTIRTPHPMTSSSAIPAAVIQRIVRANYGHFRACYQDGLRRNPSLEGRVAVSFIINRDGTVYGAANGGSSLADPSVVSCVVSSFGGLTFPAPENGIVTVTYPIMLIAPTV
ncbi:MAG: AgmX/PglI C-terminal domain-containing protein [Deltaproteobacteria bacterium]|nr:AgmX/PglI C-terminal domain-containing protein [Deltaproteobacteria bacterium]